VISVVLRVIALTIVLFACYALAGSVVGLQGNSSTADQASSASQKSFYFDKFVQDLRDQGLTSGDTAIFYPTVNSRMEHLFNNTLSLQDSLHGTVEVCKAGRTFDCNTAMQQITLQEFCWFPIDNFRSGYMLKHGAWGDANWFPKDQANRCTSAHS